MAHLQGLARRALIGTSKKRRSRLVGLRITTRAAATAARCVGGELVELQGLEPWTSCMPCRRSSS